MRTFAEVEDIVSSFVLPLDRSSSYSLDRIEKILEELGNPQEQFKTIHIAGTSGKTSTSYFIANMLSRAGYKTGLSVSPYVEEMNERVQIGTEPLKEATFCKEMTGFMNILNTLSIKPTYFELFVAFAYWYFAKIKVDYAVVEVGLGGLLDGTNVIKRHDKICVITDIGLDHTDILGKTLKDIAWQKAGIIQNHNHVFMYRQGKDVEVKVLERCRGEHAALHYIEYEHVQADIPDFQKRNWFLAKNVCEHILERNGRREPDKWWAETTRVTIPGRLEIFELKDKKLILDGAHNPQKIKTLVKSFKKMFPDEHPVIMLSIGSNRATQSIEIATELKKLSAFTIITTFSKGYDAAKLAANFEPGSSLVEANLETALKALLARNEKLFLVTGSLYLVGEVRKKLRKLN